MKIMPKELDYKKINPASKPRSRASSLRGKQVLVRGKEKMAYDHQKVERKWWKEWMKRGIYKAEDFSPKPKWYGLIEFPYPSGDGLHVGHPRPYIGMDVVARKRRMQGYNVLYPIGWDAFGLPTENYAIKTGIHPAVVTKRNTDIFRRQIQMLGISFDWSREINTTDPAYYKWTQWIFLQFFKHGLAYKKKMPINWCPRCKIGLANEEVINGKCERCGNTVEEREKEQWLLAITKYADRLLKDLDKVDYWEKIKIQQKNWIGKSEGAEIKFPISNSKFSINVFTTRPDTLFGATYMVLAPEHPVLEKREKGIVESIKNWKEVESYIKKAKRRTEEERKDSKEKTGVELKGIKAINPANKKEIPIFVADYVLGGYGTGAIMAVPAHDERDYEFAKKYKLPIVKVIKNPKGETVLPYTEEGIVINSARWMNGLLSQDAFEEIIDELEHRNLAKRKSQYHLRDWIFSRQRYWGEPIPLVFCEKEKKWIPVPEKDLPVKLPEVKNFKPTDTGESPLAKEKKWVNTKCPNCGGPARRETDTMPNWAGSSWYFLAYATKSKRYSLNAKSLLRYWMPVDWYNGGMEHATLHLLYSRFWNKFLYDIGIVPVDEPYKKRTSHGLILAEGGLKMSKSKGNVINPDALVEEFGADALRVYEMFMGPFDQAIAWDHRGLVGVTRFLTRVWEMRQKVSSNKKLENRELLRALHRTIKKIGDDIEVMGFNTAVSSLMILLNKFSGAGEIPQSIWERFLVILAPFAPFMAEELYQQLKLRGLTPIKARINADKNISENQSQNQRKSAFRSVHEESWPQYDPKLIEEDTFELVIQVNGKVRDKVELRRGVKQEEAERTALNRLKIKALVGVGKPRKIIFVPNRLVNIVTNL